MDLSLVRTFGPFRPFHTNVRHDPIIIWLLEQKFQVPLIRLTLYFRRKAVIRSHWGKEIKSHGDSLVIIEYILCFVILLSQYIYLITV